MALFTAGQDLTAAGLNALVTNTTAVSLAAASTTRTEASASDIPGCSVTINTVAPNVKILIFGAFDVSQTTAGDIFLGTCTVSTISGGAAFPNEAHANVAGRVTVSQFWFATLVTPGAHTIKLRGQVTSGTDTQTNAQHTTLTVFQFAI